MAHHFLVKENDRVVLKLFDIDGIDKSLCDTNKVLSSLTVSLASVENDLVELSEKVGKSSEESMQLEIQMSMLKRHFDKLKGEIMTALNNELDRLQQLFIQQKATMETLQTQVDILSDQNSRYFLDSRPIFAGQFDFQEAADNLGNTRNPMKILIECVQYLARQDVKYKQMEDEYGALRRKLVLLEDQQRLQQTQILDKIAEENRRLSGVIFNLERKIIEKTSDKFVKFSTQQ